MTLILKKFPDPLGNQAKQRNPQFPAAAHRWYLHLVWYIRHDITIIQPSCPLAIKRGSPENKPILEIANSWKIVRKLGKFPERRVSPPEQNF